MREAAAIAAAAGADLIDLNMGCPVPKVLQDRAPARRCCATPSSRSRSPAAAAEGSRPAGDGEAALRDRARRPLRLRARRCGWSPRPGVAAIAFHPRAGDRAPPRPARLRARRASSSRARRVGRCPVIVSGGLRDRRARARAPTSESGADAVMIARGSLGNPWIFERADRRARASRRARRRSRPSCAGCIDRAEEHWGAERAARNLRKFYPWYVERARLRGPGAPTRFQRTRRASTRSASCSPLGPPRRAAGGSSRRAASL